MISGTAARVSAGIQLQTSLQNDVATLQNQISTGKRLSQPSDDPVAAVRIDGIRQGQADDTAYQGNVDTAAAIATRVDSAMSSLSTALTQALQTVTQAATGTGTADSRAAAAAQLRGLAQGITQLAAQKDSNGQPLFPDGAALQIPIASGVTVAPGVSRAALFSMTNADGTTTGMADLLSAAADAIGGATSATASTVAAPFLSSIQSAATQVTTVHAEQGIRAAQIDARGDAIATDKTDLASERSGLEDTDLSAAISLISSKLTTLQAAQAVFSKVNSRTLFDAIG